MKDYKIREVPYGNRTSNNLQYLNETIDKMVIDFELRLLPKWLQFSKKKEKTLEEKIRDCDRDENGIPYSSPP